MSRPNIKRFHDGSLHLPAHNSEAAEKARQRIQDLPDPYNEHVTPAKEDLVGVLHPHSPAASSEPASTHPQSSLHISSTARHATGFNTPAPAEPTAIKHPEVIPPEHFDPAQPPVHHRLWQKIRARLRMIIIAVGAFGLLFIIYKAPIFLSELGYLTAKPETAVVEPAAPQVPPNPVINIPKINVSAPLVFAKSNIEADFQKDLESGVVHYANTAMPGEPGNSVLFGHSSNDWWEPGNYKFVFVLLEKLVVGDTFSVNYNSKQYVYQVTETKVIEPTDLSVLNSTGTPEMTLITCTPPGTSWKRFVVRSKQISPEPQTVQVPTQANTADDKALPGNSATSITDQLTKWWQSFTSGW